MMTERDVEGRRWLSVEGPLNIDDVAPLLLAAAPRVRDADAVLDMAGVTELDSSALALVLALLREAQAGGRRLALANAPDSFVSLAGLYGIETMLAEYLAPHGSH